MIRLVTAVGAVALVLAGCAGNGASTTTDTIDDPPVTDTDTVDTEPADSGDGDSGSIVISDVCDLYDGIDVELLIKEAPGDFTSRDSECAVAAADAAVFAQSAITLGNAPAILVMRTSYEGPLYDCPVEDITGLGDEAFSCLGGPATNHVVFTVGEHLVMFSAGNNVKGPPSDADFLEAAQQIYANMTR